MEASINKKTMQGKYEGQKNGGEAIKKQSITLCGARTFPNMTKSTLLNDENITVPKSIDGE